MSEIIRGVKWTAIERFTNQFVQLLVSIIIARIISPEEYGVLGILLVFTNIAQVFIDSGLGNSLIYFNNLDRKYLDTTFVFNSAVSIVVVVGLFILAPNVERFYNLPNLGVYLRSVSLVLITNSAIVVPTAILKVKLDFRSLSITNLISNCVSAIIGVFMAYIGTGIWALIGQILSKSLLQSTILLITCKWFPKCSFDTTSFKKLYKYGVNIFGTSILTKFTDEGITSAIGKFLSPYNLGLYSRSGQFATFPTSFIGSLVNTVLYPSLSSMKDNKKKYNQLFEASLEIQAAFTIPLYLILAMVAEPIIIILLTEKWIDAVPVFQILCAGRVLAPLAITTEQNLMAKGRSDLFLKQQIFKLLLKIILVIIALPFGIIAIAFADAIQTIMQFFITNAVARNTIGYTIKMQIKIIYPYIISSLLAVGAGYSFSFISNGLIFQLIGSTITAILIYIFLISLFKRELIKFLLKNIFD